MIGIATGSIDNLYCRGISLPASLFNPLALDNLIFAWQGGITGTSLEDVSGNNNHIPLVSGSGLEAIYDFSGLGDTRLNLNAYVGNSYSLPENMDFPYPTGIYHDSNNPYHHKLSNFHYRYWNKQSLLIDNIVFAKLTYVGSILQSIDELYIFSSPQSGTVLDLLKKHIGITADHWSANKVLEADFSSLLYWAANDCNASVANNTAILQDLGVNIIGSNFVQVVHVDLFSTNKIRVSIELDEADPNETISLVVQERTLAGGFISYLHRGVINLGSNEFELSVSKEALQYYYGFYASNKPNRFVISQPTLKLNHKDYYKHED